VGGVEDVLDPERHAFHQRVSASRTRGGQGSLAGDVRPRTHHGIAVADAVETALHHGLGGERAILDLTDEFGGREAMLFYVRHGDSSRRGRHTLASFALAA